MSASTSRRPATAVTAAVHEALVKPSAEPAEQAGKRGARAGADDWMTAAVVFGILGGCAGLWLADLSLVTGTLGAVCSGLAGIFFADS